MKKLFSRHPVCLVILLAIILRLAIVAFSPILFDNRIIDNYDVLAQNLLDGNGFSYAAGEAKPTVTRAPFYPFYLAALLALVGHNFFWLRFMEAMVDVGTTYLVYALVIRNVRGNLNSAHSRRLGLVAALVYALQPFSIYYTVKLGPESWFTFYLTLTIIFFFEFLRAGPSLWRSVLWGGSLGVLSLNKSVAILLPGLFLVLLVQQHKLSGSHLRGAVLAMVVMLALIAPWSLRNYRVARAFVPVQTLTWWNFWYDFDVRVGETSFATVERLYQVEIGGHPYGLTAPMDVAQETHLRQEAMSWITRNPLAFAEKTLCNVGEFWYLVESWPKAGVIIVFWLVSLPFAVWGLVVGLRSPSLSLLAIGSLLTIMYFNLVYAPVFAVFRYSLVVVPFLTVLIAIALVEMISQIAQR